ncbi:orotate phosphoribosyltransferase [Nocardia sp. NPDC006044]|uniref:orotate phosphoribosyltransferase n=1 Tax=Nocardia sp. NPDC006044 TaxID=3364306 RepID=UPI00369D2608
MSELAELIRDQALVRGRFTLASGATSDHYFDLRRISLHPRGAQLIGDAIIDYAGEWVYDAVAGLALGAVPVALAAMTAARDRGRQVPALIIRKEPKQHGLRRRIEGGDVRDKRILIVEDTSTTGDSTLIAVDAVREAGGTVAGVLLLVDRGGAEAISAAGIAVRSVFSAADLL